MRKKTEDVLAENDSDSDESIQTVSADESNPPACPQIIASQFEENWRGLIASPKTRKLRASKYIGNDKHVFEAFKYPQHRQFPILKNGSAGHGVISKNRHTYTVKNTCAFDSILQVILLVLTKNPVIREVIHTTKNGFLRLVLRMHEKGIVGAHLYNMRSKLLYEYLSGENQRKTVHDKFTSLDCAINIASAVMHTFRGDPSCEEVSACVSGCSRIVKKRIVIPLKIKDLFETDFDAVVNEKMTLAERLCSTACQSMVKTTLQSTGMCKEHYPFKI